MTLRNVAVLALLVLAGCRGKAMGTVPLLRPGTAETHFQATGKKVVFWADTDGKWSGNDDSRMQVEYEIDIFQGKNSLGHISCATTQSGGSSVCGTTMNINGAHSGDCELSMSCEVPVIPAGDTTVKVTGRTGPNVTEVKKMSLNIREK